MIKIGRGFYYNVYDLSNGRVLKTPRSRFGQISQLVIWYIFKPKILITELKRAPYKRKAIENEWEKTQRVIENIPHLIGHPTVISAYTYEQDKVIPLGNLYHILSEEQIKEKIDQYTDLTFEAWKYGVADTVFNFFLNIGMDKNGQLIFLDLNEFTQRKDEILFELKSLRFFRSPSFIRLPNGELKEYIRNKFEESFTKDNLDKYWNRK
ncbi:MAG: hypothetical protein JWN37_878 [Candidatus Nomurabacteria bacterium]|nr:hypothetical protein [Candidatus Nomurabacteria bacterium]